MGRIKDHFHEELCSRANEEPWGPEPADIEQFYCAAPGCAKKHHAKGYCKAHYLRQYRTGHLGLRYTPRGQQLEWLKRHTSWDGDACLIWPFYRSSDGIGQATYNGVKRTAHNIMCRLAHGEPPTPNHESAHSCGNSHNGCVNPKHLRWATRKENCADMVLHGTSVRGEKNRIAKLTEAQVREIRRAPGKLADIGKRYEISNGHVCMIKKGHIWKHVEDAEPDDAHAMYADRELERAKDLLRAGAPRLEERKMP